MERVADDDEGRGAAGMDLALVPLAVMAVAPQHEFLEEKESQNTSQQCPERRARRQRRERFGEQREQRDAQQRADGIADRPRYEPRAQVVANQQETGRSEQAAEASENTQSDGRSERLHRGIISVALAAPALRGNGKW
jgi:hypothetical protein